jgi:hypothetical protein
MYQVFRENVNTFFYVTVKEIILIRLKPEFFFSIEWHNFQINHYQPIIINFIFHRYIKISTYSVKIAHAQIINIKLLLVLFQAVKPPTYECPTGFNGTTCESKYIF